MHSRELCPTASLQHARMLCVVLWQLNPVCYPHSPTKKRRWYLKVSAHTAHNLIKSLSCRSMLQPQCPTHWVLATF